MCMILVQFLLHVVRKLLPSAIEPYTLQAFMDCIWLQAGPQRTGTQWLGMQLALAASSKRGLPCQTPKTHSPRPQP